MESESKANCRRFGAKKEIVASSDVFLIHLPGAPEHTGNWVPQFVFVDPNGDPRPNGGVRWTSDGPGLLVGETRNLGITMTGTADSSYVMFGLDASVGQFQEVLNDLGDTPWYEDFETHYEGVGCHGWRA